MLAWTAVILGWALPARRRWKRATERANARVERLDAAVREVLRQLPVEVTQEEVAQEEERGP
jgi:hypothetical protein